MKAIVFNIRLNSLYSIRIPFTWQSALTYPLLPPSAVTGMLANALQRYKNNKHPLEYLNLIEDNLIWAGSRLLSPSVIKSYTTSAITKWEDKIGGKFTNALGRQFAYTNHMQVAAVFIEDNLINDIVESLKTSPLTCGDSESAVSLDSELMVKEVEEVTGLTEVETEYPFPFSKETVILEGKGQLYLMHERCRQKEHNFPLILYFVPIEEKEKIFYPSSVRVRPSIEEVFNIQDLGYILKSKPEEPEPKTRKRKN